MFDQVVKLHIVRVKVTSSNPFKTIFYVLYSGRVFSYFQVYNNSNRFEQLTNCISLGETFLTSPLDIFQVSNPNKFGQLLPLPLCVAN